MWALRRSVDPTTEVLSTAEAKAHMRVDTSEDDALIDAMVAAATKWCEEYCGRQFITATYVLTADDFPAYDRDTDEYAITLYYPPIQSITSIAYIDAGGDSQTWDSDKYQVDLYSLPPRIQPAWGETYPTTRSQYETLTVTYDAGYGDDATDVPDGIRMAVRMLAAHQYENREASSEIDMKVVPMGIKALLAPFRTSKIPRG